MGAVDWADRGGGLACILQPRLLLVVGGGDLGIFAHLLSLYRFSGVGATDFLLAFFGGVFSPDWMGWGGWRLLPFFLFLFIPFSRPPKRECGESKAGLGGVSYHAPEFSGDGFSPPWAAADWASSCLATFDWLELAGWVGLVFWLFDDDDDDD